MTSDTTEINTLLAALPPEGGIVELDAGRVYDIDPELTANGGVRMTGVGKTLKLNGATLRAIPNSLPAYAVLRMGVGAQDPAEARMHRGLRVVGPGVIEGDRYTHTDTVGEQGMCVWFSNCEDARVSGVEMRHGWGDGAYYGYNDLTPGSLGGPQYRPLKTELERCWIHHNRRNGVSLIGATYADIVGCLIEDQDGTGPYAGIDIEPDSQYGGADTVRILRNTLRRNQGPGLEIVNVIGGPVGDVSVEQNIITANGFVNGFGVKVVDMQAGWLSLVSNFVTNNYGDGIYIERKNHPLTDIDIALNRVRGQQAHTVAYDGGTYCGHGMRFKGVTQAEVQMLANRVAADGLGTVVWQ